MSKSCFFCCHWLEELSKLLLDVFHSHNNACFLCDYVILEKYINSELLLLAQQADQLQVINLLNGFANIKEFPVTE